MFGIGFSEIVIIFLAIVVLVKPEDLPSFIRKVAKIIFAAKKLYREALYAKDQFIREIETVADLAADEAPEARRNASPEPAGDAAEPKPEPPSGDPYGMDRAAPEKKNR